MENHLLITRTELLKFMTKEKYKEFIDHLITRTKHVDYETYDGKSDIWLFAEW